MRLASKLLVLLFLVIVLFLSVYGFLSARREIALVHADMERDAVLVGLTVRNMFADVWRMGGEARARKLVADADRGEPGLRIRWVWLDLPEGLGDSPRIDGAQVAAALVGVEAVTVESRGFLYTYIPLDTGVGRPGALEIGESLAFVKDTIRSEILRIAALTASIAAATVGLAAILGLRLVGRPVQALIDKARRMGAGDLTAPLELRGVDELSELAHEVNLMCDRLAESLERVQAESEARVAALEQLRHADRLKTAGGLASGIAHELGTPLNVISARADLLTGEGDATEEVVEGARIIKDQVDRMTRIVRQFLDFARPSTPKREPAELREIASRTVEMMRPLAKRHGVEIRFDEGTGSTRLRIDSGQIQQVLTNLVMNAIQASPKGAEVAVAIRRFLGRDPEARGAGEREWVAAEVRDRGPGISPEDRARIFEPFFTTKGGTEGTGLGLSIVEGIVREHGGCIDVMSEAGKGSAFTVRFPVETKACEADS